jgi:hypothetical protein
VSPKRPKVEPIRQPTLFEMEKLEKAAEPMSKLEVERPYDQHPGILISTQVWSGQKIVDVRLATLMSNHSVAAQ